MQKKGADFMIDMNDLWFRWSDLEEALAEESPGRYSKSEVKLMTITINFVKASKGYKEAVKAALEDHYQVAFLPERFEVKGFNIRKGKNVTIIKEEDGITKVFPNPEEGCKVQEGKVEVLMPNHRTKVYRVLVAEEGYIERLTQKLLEVAAKREEKEEQELAAEKAAKQESAKKRSEAWKKIVKKATKCG